MKKFLTVLLPLILTGCMNIDYTGKKFAPQEHVKFVTQLSEVPLDDYILIGRFTADPHLKTHPYKVEEAVLEKSREYGGDILLFVSAKEVPRGTYKHNSEEFGAPDPAARKISAEEKERFGKPSPLASPRENRKKRRIYTYNLYKKKSDVKTQLGY